MPKDERRDLDLKRLGRGGGGCGGCILNIVIAKGCGGGVQFSYVIILGGTVLIHHTVLKNPAPLWDVINDRSLNILTNFRLNVLIKKGS